jgi:hypothetical protein
MVSQRLLFLEPSTRADFVAISFPSAIDHWQMPPIWILLLVARRTVNQLIPHAFVLFYSRLFFFGTPD